MEALTAGSTASTQTTRKPLVVVAANTLEQIQALPEELRPGELVDYAEFAEKILQDSSDIGGPATAAFVLYYELTKRLEEVSAAGVTLYFLHSYQNVSELPDTGIRIHTQLDQFWVAHRITERMKFRAGAMLAIFGDQRRLFCAKGNLVVPAATWVMGGQGNRDVPTEQLEHWRRVIEGTKSPHRNPIE